MCNRNKCEEDHRRLRHKLSRCEKKAWNRPFAAKSYVAYQVQKKKKMTGYNLNSNRDGKNMKIFAPKPIRGEVTDTQIQDFMDVKMSAKLL